MKRIAVLGSTGSIGKNVLNVARHLKESDQVDAIAAHCNIICPAAAPRSRRLTLHACALG